MRSQPLQIILVVGHGLGVTLPYLVPKLGVWASWGSVYGSAVQLVYNPSGPFLAARLYFCDISI